MLLSEIIIFISIIFFSLCFCISFHSGFFIGVNDLKFLKVFRLLNILSILNNAMACIFSTHFLSISFRRFFLRLSSQRNQQQFLSSTLYFQTFSALWQDTNIYLSFSLSYILRTDIYYYVLTCWPGQKCVGGNWLMKWDKVKKNPIILS